MCRPKKVCAVGRTTGDLRSARPHGAKVVVLKGGVKHADNEKPRGGGGAKRPRLAPEVDYL
jgi:hypothetical protein